MKQNLRLISIFFLVITLGFLILYVSGVFSWFELKMADFNLKHIEQNTIDTNVVIIEYDDKTAENRLSPVSTQEIMRLVWALEKYDPKVIAIDNFSIYGQSGRIDTIPEFFTAYKNICLGMGLVVPAEQYYNSNTRDFQEISEFLYPLSNKTRSNIYSAQQLFTGANYAVNRAKSIGHLVLFNDADGIFRRIPAIVQCGNGLLFSFGIQAALDYCNVEKKQIDVKRFSVDIPGGKPLYLNEQGLMLIRYQKSISNIKTVSMIDLLNGISQTDSIKERFSYLKNKLVFIGNSSTRTARFCSTPVLPYCPSIRLHATVASNILQQTSIHETPKLFAIIMIVLVGIIMTALFVIPKSSMAGTSTLSGIPVFIIGGLIAARFGIIFPVFSLSFYCMVLYLFLIVIRHLHSKDLLLEELKSLQNEVRLKERLATIGEMSSKVAHEIRNPLNAIQLHLSLLKRKNVQYRTDEFLDIISEESQRLNLFISSLLQFGKPVNLSMKQVNITDEIDSVIRFLSPEINQKNIDIEICHEVKDISLYADGNQLREVLLNIVKNSMESIQCDGSIKIKSFKCHDYFTIVITDDGKGVDENSIGKIFTPFFTTKPQGTGLGLSIVKKIIDAHGGLIEFKSKSGYGTTVIIQLSYKNRVTGDIAR